MPVHQEDICIGTLSNQNSILEYQNSPLHYVEGFYQVRRNKQYADNGEYLSDMWRILNPSTG